MDAPDSGPQGSPLPGTWFDLSVDDPKARVQAFLDSYKPRDNDLPEVGAILCVVPCPGSVPPCDGPAACAGLSSCLRRPSTKQQTDCWQTFDLALMRRHLRLVDAYRLPNGMAIATFSMLVTTSLCNRTGMLHGGAASMIVDMCTTMAQAPIAKPGFWHFGGVSRTLSVTYLRPISKDIEILIVCEVMQVGKALGECLLTSGTLAEIFDCVLWQNVTNETTSDYTSQDLSKSGHGSTLYRRT